MKIDEKITQINNRLLAGSAAFLAMGATALLNSNFELSLLIPIFAVIGGKELTNKLAKKKKLSHSLLPSIYQKSFTSWLNNYIDKSENDIEKKYKILLTSFCLRKQNINPENLIHNSFDKAYKWCKEYSIFDKSGTGDNFFALPDYYINYNEYTKEDFKKSQNLSIAQKVYKDFNHFGLLGKIIANLDMPHDNTQFLTNLQSFKLTSQDLKEITKRTHEILNTPTDERRIHMKPGAVEAEFISNVLNHNHEHIHILKEFYTAAFLNNGQTSDPEFLQKLNNLSQTKDRIEHLEEVLPVKTEERVKTKKL